MSDITLKILALLAGFVGMEGVAWLSHKYIMHGILWMLHRDHHQPHKHRFLEGNDLFFFIFATPAFFLMFFGADAIDWRFYMGSGISMYGMTYLVVHDIFIHRRFKSMKPKWNNVYFEALRRAHRMHHKHLGPQDGECFGMLWVPWKYFKEAKQKLRSKNAHVPAR
jgi:beta-carotene 3-hydroxylase